MSANIFSILRRPGTLPLDTKVAAPGTTNCRPRLIFSSDEDYAIPFVRVPPDYAERLLAAHRIAAEVRARRREMQVFRRRGTEWTAE